MILYRAMCPEEADKTLESKRLQFKNKNKWFSFHLNDFIRSRVQDGKFNNSNFEKDRYVRVLEFEFNDSSLEYFSNVGYKELMLNVRKVPLVKLISVLEIIK